MIASILQPEDELLLIETVRLIRQALEEAPA
jgi:hypothetical protein